MALKVKPLSDRIVVRQADAEEISSGGIILPDTAQEKPQQGKVMSIGPGKTADNGELIKMSLKVGDRVLYGKYSGTEVTIDGEEYVFMRESDILAIL
jgi:chaperonin GroES